MSCPMVMFTPAKAIWDATLNITGIDLLDPAPFGTKAGSVLLKCSNGATQNLPLVGIWDPISLTVTLPPPGSLAGCSAPFKIVVNYTTGITLLNPQGTPQTCEYDIEIIDVGLKLPDLIDKANKFTISVSPLATEKILAGEPAVLDLIWPEIPGVNFMDSNGTLLKSHTDHMMQKASILSRELRMIASYRGKKKSINNILKTVAPARKILYNRITAEKALERSPSTMTHMKTYHGKDRVKFPKTIPPGGADITVNIEWIVFELDEQGNEIIHTKGASHKYVDPTDAKTAADEFAVPVGLLMTPVIVPAIKNTSTPVVMNLSVRATLTLTFKNITTPPVPLSFKSLPVPVIALPSVLVLFGAENFGGHVLACVPNNAGIQQAGNIVPLDTLDQLKGALETIRNSLQNIKDLLMVAGWLTGLDSVTDVLSVLDKNPQLAIAGDDNSINLEDYDLERIAGIWYDWDDDPSSMIFVAAPGGSVTCLFPWNLGDVNRAYWNYGGEIQLNTDLDLSVSVKTLDTNQPKPLNVVNGQNSQTKLIIVEGNDDGFDDIMHKVQF